VGQAIGFERALRENGVPIQLVIYSRESHRIRERQHQRDQLRRVLMWFNRWLRNDEHHVRGSEVHGSKSPVS